jgi:hypothetical protein
MMKRCRPGEKDGEERTAREIPANVNGAPSDGRCMVERSTRVGSARYQIYLRGILATEQDLDCGLKRERYRYSAAATDALEGVQAFKLQGPRRGTPEMNTEKSRRSDERGLRMSPSS